jgi:uncharacterized protein YbbC (DUF1343 family)
MNAIYLYPSLCFFEGTPVSVGRGTDAPFQQFGHPAFSEYSYSFTPTPTQGAKSPKLNGKVCYGVDFTEGQNEKPRNWKQLNLSYLIDSYKMYPDKEKYFTNFFNLLAGNSSLKEAIKAGKTESEIRATWGEDLAVFIQFRSKYLLYEE